MSTKLEPPFSLRCFECNEQYEDQDSLQRHIYDAHVASAPPKPTSALAPYTSAEQQQHEESQAVSGLLSLKDCPVPLATCSAVPTSISPTSAAKTKSQQSSIKSEGSAAGGASSDKIFNPEAYCEFCKKQFCNKYFLRTHKFQQHGVPLNPPRGSMSMKSLQGARCPTPSVMATNKGASDPLGSALFNSGTSNVSQVGLFGAGGSCDPAVAAVIGELRSTQAPSHHPSSLYPPGTADLAGFASANSGAPECLKPREALLASAHSSPVDATLSKSGATAPGSAKVSSGGMTPAFDSFCPICQQDFATPGLLQFHVFTTHGTHMISPTAAAMAAMDVQSLYYNAAAAAAAASGFPTGGGTNPLDHYLQQTLLAERLGFCTGSTGQNAAGGPNAGIYPSYYAMAGMDPLAVASKQQTMFADALTDVQSQQQQQHMAAFTSNPLFTSPADSLLFASRLAQSNPMESTGQHHHHDDNEDKTDDQKLEESQSLLDPLELVGDITAAISKQSKPPSNPVDPQRFCEFCQKEFCNKYFLRSHIAKKHYGSPDKTLTSPTGSENRSAIVSSANWKHSPRAITTSATSWNQQCATNTLTKVSVDEIFGCGSISGRSPENHQTLNLDRENGCAEVKRQEENIGFRSTDCSPVPAPDESSSGLQLEEMIELRKVKQESGDTTDGITGVKGDVTMGDCSDVTSMEVGGSLETDPRFDCDICGQVFRSSLAVMAHRYQDHGALFMNSDLAAGGGNSNHSGSPLLNLLDIGGITEAMDMSCGTKGAASSLVTPTAWTGIRPKIPPNIDPEAYCELCQREFCSKYFLKTHKQNMHLIPKDSPQSTSAPRVTVTNSRPVITLPTTANSTGSESDLNLTTSSVTSRVSPSDSKNVQPRTGGSGKNFCDFCRKELCNKYFLKTHMRKMHRLEVDENKTILGIVDTAFEVSYRCDICAKQLSSRHFLNVHKLNAHGISKEDSCSQRGPYGNGTLPTMASALPHSVSQLIDQSCRGDVSPDFAGFNRRKSSSASSIDFDNAWVEISLDQNLAQDFSISSKSRSFREADPVAALSAGDQTVATADVDGEAATFASDFQHLPGQPLEGGKSSVQVCDCGQGNDGGCLSCRTSSVVPVACKLCDAPFDNVAQLELHLKTSHSGSALQGGGTLEENDGCVEYACDNTNSGTVDREIRTLGPKSRKRVIPNPGFTCDSQQLLKCATCHRNYSTRHALTNHVVRVHHTALLLASKLTRTRGNLASTRQSGERQRHSGPGPYATFRLTRAVVRRYKCAAGVTDSDNRKTLLGRQFAALNCASRRRIAKSKKFKKTAQLDACSTNPTAQPSAVQSQPTAGPAVGSFRAVNGLLPAPHTAKTSPVRAAVPALQRHLPLDPNQYQTFRVEQIGGPNILGTQQKTMILPTKAPVSNRIHITLALTPVMANNRNAMIKI